MSLGTNLYTLRARAGMSQDALAERLEVSRQSVSKWETDASVPELEKLIRLSELFGVTLDELVRGDVTAPPEPAPEFSEPMPDIPEGAAPETPSKRPPVSHEQMVAGNALLITAAVLAVVIPLVLGLDGLLLAAALDLVLIPCGIICRRCPKRAALWCVWAVWLWADGFVVTFMSGSTWSILALITGNPEILRQMTWQLILSGVLLATLAAMIAWTVWSFRHTPLSRTPGNIALALGLWAGRLALVLTLTPLLNVLIRTDSYTLLGILHPLLLLLQDILTAAAVVVTAALIRKRQ